MDPSVVEAAKMIERASRVLVRQAAHGTPGALLALDRATRALDDRTRVAGVLLHRRGVTYGDLGRLLGITPEQARSRLVVDDHHPVAGTAAPRWRRTPQRRQRATLDALRRRGPGALVSARDLGADIGVDPSTTARYLRPLIARGQIERVGGGNAVRYRLVDGGEMGSAVANGTSQDLRVSAADFPGGYAVSGQTDPHGRGVNTCEA